MISYRKVVITAPEVVELQTAELDETALKPNELLIKKYYSLISAGTETACRSGKELWFKLPGVPGYSGVGEVVAAGKQAKRFQIGDIVYYKGKHCEYEVVSEDDLVIKIPDGTPLEYVPFVRMAAISSSAIRASNIEFGDDVAVIGQGLIGLTAMMEAKMQGARVIAVDPSEKRLAIAKQCGADETLNPNTVNVKEVIEQLTEKRMVTTLIDATGSSKVVCENIGNIAWGGELILLGSPRKPYEANVTELLQHIHQFRFNVEVKGAHEMRYPLMGGNKFVKHSTERTSRILIEKLRDGSFPVKPLLTQKVRPEDAAEVYARIAAGDEEYLGVIFDWTK